MQKQTNAQGRPTKQVTFHAEEPVRRRQRRHTTGGTQQNLDAIAKAKQLLDNASLQDGQGTLDRKQLITMLKDRYGNKLDNRYKPSAQAESNEVTHRQMTANQQLAKSTGGETDGRQLQSNATHLNVRSRTTSSSSKDDSNESLRSKDSRSILPGGGHRKIIREQIETTTITKIPPPVSPQSNGYHHPNGNVELSDNSTESGQEQSQAVYLQYKDEVRKVTMPTMITSIQTLQALFVTSFPSKISMISFEEQPRPIYIKDTSNDIFYQLDDLSDIKPRCLLKIHERASSHESLAALASHMKNEFYSYGQPASWDDRSATDTNSLLRTRTLPNRKMQQKQGYAESLQEFQLPSSQIRRAGSNKSLQSDSVLTRNEWRTEGSNQRPSVQTKEAVTETHVYSQATPTQHLQPESSLTTAQQRTRSRSFNGNDAKLRKEMTRETTHQQNQRTTTTNQLTSEESKKGTPPIKSAMKGSSTVKTSGTSSNTMAPTGSNLRSRPIAEERATVTVEEQLDDLTELLQSAIDGDHTENKRKNSAPGKLNRNVIEMLEASKQRASAMNLQNRASFKATALIMTGSDDPSQSTDSLSSSTMESPRSLVSPRSTSEDDEVFAGARPGEPADTSQSGLSKLLMRDHNSGQMGTSTTTSKAVQSAVYGSPSVVQRPSYVNQKRETSFGSVEGNKTMKEESPKPPVRVSSKSIFISGKTKTVQPKPAVQQKPQNGVHRSPVRDSIAALRTQLGQLRLDHKEYVHNFGEFFTEMQREFCTIVSSMADQKWNSNNNNENNSCIGNENPVRHKRVRLEQDQFSYNKKSVHTDRLLGGLEEETEILRRDVLAKKSIVDTSLINSLSEDLHDVTKSVAELKYRFGGIQDNLKVVMSGELEVIVGEEKFLKAEPAALEKMQARCKHLSGTLFTLQKLASVQNMAQDEREVQEKIDINGNIPTVQKITVTSSFRQTETEPRPVQRTVRFVNN